MNRFRNPDPDNIHGNIYYGVQDKINFAHKELDIPTYDSVIGISQRTELEFLPPPGEDRPGAYKDPVKCRAIITFHVQWDDKIVEFEYDGISIEEHVPDDRVNDKSYVENCQTSAIGRAYANAGWAGDAERASSEEMGQNRSSAADNSPPSSSNDGSKLVNEFDLDFNDEGIADQNEAFKKAWFGDQQSQLKQAGYRTFQKDGKWVVGNNRLKGAKPMSNDTFNNLRGEFAQVIRGSEDDFRALYLKDNAPRNPIDTALLAIAVKYGITDWLPENKHQDPLTKRLTEIQMRDCISTLTAARGNPERVANFMAEFWGDGKPPTQTQSDEAVPSAEAKAGDKVTDDDMPF